MRGLFPRVGGVAIVLAATWAVVRGLGIEGVLPPGPSLELLAARLGFGGLPLAQFPLWQTATAPLLLLPSSWWPAAFPFFSVACGALSGALLCLELARLKHDRTVMERAWLRRGYSWGGGPALAMAAGATALWLLSVPLWEKSRGVSAEPFHALVLVALVSLGCRATTRDGTWRWGLWAFLLGGMLAEYAMAWVVLPAAAFWVLRARWRRLNDMAFWRGFGLAFAAGFSAWLWVPTFHALSAAPGAMTGTTFWGLLKQNALYVRATFQTFPPSIWFTVILGCAVPVALVSIRWRDGASRSLAHEVIERLGFGLFTFGTAAFLVQRHPFGLEALGDLPCAALFSLAMVCALAYLLGYWWIQLRHWSGTVGAVAVAVALGLPLLSLARIAREPAEPSTASLRALLRLTRVSIPADTRAVILCEPSWWGQALAVNAPEDWPASRYRLVTDRELLLRGYDAATWAVCAPEFFRRPRGRTRGAFELGDWATALTPGTALYVTGELPPEMRKTCFSTMSGILQRLVPKEQASGVALTVPEAVSFWREATPLLADASASNSDPVCATLARSLNFALASSRTPDLRLATCGTLLRAANPSLALNLRLLRKAKEREAVREAWALATALERGIWSGWDISLWHGHFGPVLSATHFRALSAFWFRRGHLPAARWAVNRALAFDSSDEGAAYLSVELAVQEGRSAEALREAEAFLAGHPKLPSRPRARLHQLAALTARNLGQFDLAEHHFTQAVEADHNLPGLDYEFAVLRLLQRRWDDAAARFSALLATAPGRADTLLGLGLSEASRGRKEAARVVLNQALTVAPEDSRASLLLAWLDAREGRLAEAESRLLSQVAKGRDAGPARDLLAAVRAAKEELPGTRAKPRVPPPSVSPEPPVIPLEKTAQTVPP